jgi:energy-coupling factor transporter ATP-binding protein EcfA2
MAGRFVDALVRDGLPPALVAARLERLVALLDMDMEWRLHQVSDGQRRRAQLLLKLLPPSQLLLMDEVTTDLDVVSRQALLQFLREECEARGATVVYSTHILDGLDDWPTHVLHLRGGQVAYNGPVGGAPGAKAGLGDSAGAASGSLFTLVKGWLAAERADVRAARAAADGQVDACPTTSAVVEASAAAAPVPAPAPTFASRFDRFGGASRQSMYAM